MGELSAGRGWMDVMTDTTPPCPECTCEYTYPLDALIICPECAHEWAPGEETPDPGEGGDAVIVDSVGNPLHDGDTVTLRCIRWRNRLYAAHLVALRWVAS